MTSDLIRKDDVLNILEDLKYRRANVETYVSMTLAMNKIRPMPTVDAVEVVHGEWVQKEFWPNGGTWRCSECGKQIMFQEGTPITQEIHYCPNCGAKMDGGR